MCVCVSVCVCVCVRVRRRVRDEKALLIQTSLSQGWFRLSELRVLWYMCVCVCVRVCMGMGGGGVVFVGFGIWGCEGGVVQQMINGVVDVRRS